MSEQRDNQQSWDEKTSSDGSVVYPAQGWQSHLMPPNWHIRTDKDGTPRWTTT